ncbi:SGNH/GDSL hydrolase family protein [Nocardioides lijunqiniae]|uniref:SGNH/GDSL hydrolase family protein n=1 Tax=Nocardioides lijunqiniae TaxID=2760832 RepID=UPI0018782443|nr:SGNH/GDSL hydrolase family protein [Nocardioides lijunqiniae]
MSSPWGPRRARRARLLVGVVAPTLLLLAACGSDDDPPLDTTPSSESSSEAPDETPSPSADSSADPSGGTAPPAGEAGTYVALGDSFASAPLVPETDPADGCQRSTGNYPHLVAEAAGYELTDVTCIAASTTSMVGVQITGETQNLPQFEALNEDVALVTMTVGGNDFGLFSQLLLACLPAAGADQATPCKQKLAASGQEKVLLGQVDKIRGRIEATTRGILDRAPQARVIVADYPQLLPDRGSCPDLVPLAEGDYGLVTELNKALSDAVRTGAKAGGAEVVDVFKASKGHDVCSDDPWVNGVQTDPERALALHPFAEGQQGVADLVLAKLG